MIFCILEEVFCLRDISNGDTLNTEYSDHEIF